LIGDLRGKILVLAHLSRRSWDILSPREAFPAPLSGRGGLLSLLRDSTFPPSSEGP